MTDETRLRFLAAIAKQIPAARVAEVHLFPAIRQGGVESGVAVLALEREQPISVDVDGGDVPSLDVAEVQSIETPEVVAAPPSRFTVYSAFYRHTLKGPDRGKWEVSITEEADAPLITVDAVVRGVQRRSGDLDESFRMTGEEFRAALPTSVA